MNDPSHMKTRPFPIWPPATAPDDPLSFQTSRPAFAGGTTAKPGWVNWKGKKAAEKRKRAAAAAAAGGAGAPPPGPKEVHRVRRFYPKKKPSAAARFAPSAPWNTTSFIIRAKAAGGIASLVSPCPVTPAILPTPKFSPSREVLVDMAKEEWGVDGYGSMKGLIRLRSGDAAEEDEEGSSESEVEEHVEVERRLDHDLSRFEMVYPQLGEEQYLLENRVDDQEMRVAQLEDENLLLKGRMFLMEREMGELRRRMMMMLEGEEHRTGDDDNNSNNEITVEEVEVLENEDVCSERSVRDGEEEGNEVPTPIEEVVEVLENEDVCS